MSDQIQFEDENNLMAFKSRVILGRPETPRMISFLVGKGIVRDEKSAGTVLFWIAMLFFLLTIFIFMIFVFRYNPFAPPPPTNEEIMESMGIYPN